MQKQNISTIDTNKDAITTVGSDLEPPIEAVSLFSFFD
jgi:hypothetical protein